jgi:transcription elongation factor GreA
MLPEGRDRLRAELDHLKKIERPAISAGIEVARAHGDLKENAEYHAAKDKQGMSEARIRLLETKLALAQVVDPEKLGGERVSFGATVTVLDTDSDVETVYGIVGDEEADFKHGLLNYQSPIARGLMGKEEGDDVAIVVGAGTRHFEVIDVDFRRIPLPPK